MQGAVTTHDAASLPGDKQEGDAQGADSADALVGQVDLHFYGDGLGVVEVAVDGFDLKGVVASRQVAVFDVFDVHLLDFVIFVARFVKFCTSLSYPHKFVKFCISLSYPHKFVIKSSISSIFV